MTDQPKTAPDAPANAVAPIVTDPPLDATPDTVAPETPIEPKTT